METEEPAMVKAPAKEGMGIAVGPEEYTPASPRYVRDGEDDVDDQDTDEDEDMEAPFLALKENPTPKSWNKQTTPTPLKGNTASAEDPQVSSSDQSIPELIDLREEEGVPPKRINHPTTLGLNKKMAVTVEKTPILPSPIPKGNDMTFPVAAPEVNIEAEAVPKEQIIYIDDDTDSSPLTLLERQVDCLLMPPPTETTHCAEGPCATKKRSTTPQGAGEEKTSPQCHWEENASGKKKRKALKVKHLPRGQDAHWTG